jgi:hypothetical protein
MPETKTMPTLNKAEEDALRQILKLDALNQYQRDLVEQIIRRHGGHD